MVQTTTEDAHAILDRATALSRAHVCLIAIDGAGGAGKSTLAHELASLTSQAKVVPMDDFYRPATDTVRLSVSPASGYQHYFDWQRLRDQVLVPLSTGSEATYQRYDWGMAKLNEYHTIHPTGIVIVEGVYTMREDLRSFYDLTVFVDAPRPLRLRRMVSRAANDRAMIQKWMAAEDYYVTKEDPANHADIVVRGFSD